MFILIYTHEELDSVSHVGPFATEQAAADYVELHDSDNSSPFCCVPTTIQPLYKPEETA